MAYAFTVDVESTKQINGRTHTTILVTETSVGPGNEWSVSTPEHFTVTLFETELTTAGDSSTVKPELGVQASWVVNRLDHVFQAGAATAYLRNEPNWRVVAASGTLYGRSTPNGSAAGQITTRITLVEGHDW